MAGSWPPGGVSMGTEYQPRMRLPWNESMINRWVIKSRELCSGTSSREGFMGVRANSWVVSAQNVTKSAGAMGLPPEYLS